MIEENPRTDQPYPDDASTSEPPPPQDEQAAHYKGPKRDRVDE
jgi:hypothetical protein